LAYKVSVGKPESKIPLREPRHRFVDNITMDLKNRMSGYLLDSAGSSQDIVKWQTLVNIAMKLQVLHIGVYLKPTTVTFTFRSCMQPPQCFIRVSN
jgi:hypothetical protein